MENNIFCVGESGFAAKMVSALNSPPTIFFTAAFHRRSEKSPVFSFASSFARLVQSHVGRHGGNTRSARNLRASSSMSRPGTNVSCLRNKRNEKLVAG